MDSSNDLLNWQCLGDIAGFHEYPNLLEMPVDGDEYDKQWVTINGDGTYRIGNSTVPSSGARCQTRAWSTAADFVLLIPREDRRQCGQGFACVPVF